MTKNNKPLILVVNDDGIHSKGIKVLSDAMREIGDVYVVAPDSNRSGASHAITLDKEIYINNLNNGLNEYTCSGTPVDCVKLAINKILPRLPDLCVSGINHGANHSINILYSGTAHAAIEGSIKGVPSIAFSHLSYSQSVDMSQFKSVILNLSLNVLKNKLPNGVTLNVNFPDLPIARIKGIRVSKQGDGNWIEDYKLKSSNDLVSYYWITGHFEDQKHQEDSDLWAAQNSFISIVPIVPHFTDLSAINSLKYLQYDF